MSIYFYTAAHEGKDYGFESQIYGVKKVAEELRINPKHVRRGSIAGGEHLTIPVLAQMREDYKQARP